MNKPLLLASSATLEGITRLVNGYFGAERWTVEAETLDIVRPDGTPAPSEFRVVRKGRRYRFEVEE